MKPHRCFCFLFITVITNGSDEYSFLITSSLCSVLTSENVEWKGKQRANCCRLFFFTSVRAECKHTRTLNSVVWRSEPCEDAVRMKRGPLGSSGSSKNQVTTDNGAWNGTHTHTHSSQAPLLCLRPLLPPKWQSCSWKTLEILLQLKTALC